MKPKDLAVEMFAAKMGVTVDHAKRYLKLFPPEPAWDETVERMTARGEAALLGAAQALTDTDLADLAEEDDPQAALTEMVDRRSVYHLRAQVAANARWAKEPDRAAATRKARETRWQNYLTKARELAPPGESEAGIIQRAERLRKADMQRMALKSVQARRRKK